jgi:hypothetical protein
MVFVVNFSDVDKMFSQVQSHSRDEKTEQNMANYRWKNICGKHCVLHIQLFDTDYNPKGQENHPLDSGDWYPYSGDRVFGPYCAKVTVLGHGHAGWDVNGYFGNNQDIPANTDLHINP